MTRSWLTAPVALPALAAVAVLSWLIARRTRRFALAHAVLDVPNARSSHTVPTPRGGGVAIAATALPVIAALGWHRALPLSLALSLAGGGALVALVGWLDDRRGVSAAVRAIVHLAAATAVVASMSGLDEVRLGAISVSLGLVGSLLAVLWTVWSVNLYNFMDGIDGLAGAQAVCVGAIGGALSLATGRAGVAFAAFAISASSVGFLALNWHPARLFMGDVGSGLLGFLFGALALISERIGGPPLLVWLILLSVFVVDASVTLLRRVARGERWYDAHRAHAYQRLVRSGWSHAEVTLGVVTANVVLGALAIVAQRTPAIAPGCLASAWILVGGAYAAVERRAPMGEPQA